ncbi:hypothetical protein [Magnetospirillum sp. XM-1]|uniref:hypothetical protein n=1 Tax=Magnetospirillum sp. XM-1 TaxID=1663591 RepID=UPI000837CDAB|nr:hypothetical protein [Magnetospirillum sp. XM-1]
MDWLAKATTGAARPTDNEAIRIMSIRQQLVAYLVSLLGWGIGFPLLAHAVLAPSWLELVAGLLTVAAFQGGALCLFCLNRQTAA